MKILIVDDERPARRELIFLLSSILKDAEFFEADSAQSALEILETKEIQAIFLDISLGEIMGTTLASIIHEKNPQVGIVFVTAYENYAVEAFELDALDYIMKPFDMKRVEHAVNKLIQGGYFSAGEKAGKKEQEKGTSMKIAIHGGDRIRLVDVSRIIMIQSNQRGCSIYTKDHIYEENVTMNKMEEKLKDKGFFRVHKSYIVNLNYVEELLPSYNNGYAMRLKYYESELVPISRVQAKTIKELFSIQ